MGSERFSGANSAHDTSKSAHTSQAGGEGIFANFFFIISWRSVQDIDKGTEEEVKTLKSGLGSVGGSFLNMLLAGSLVETR